MANCAAGTIHQWFSSFIAALEATGSAARGRTMRRRGRPRCGRCARQAARCTTEGLARGARAGIETAHEFNMLRIVTGAPPRPLPNRARPVMTAHPEGWPSG